MYSEEYKKYLEKEQNKDIDIKIQNIKELISAIYDISCVGGPLHIVLDDYNLEAEDIRFCQQYKIPQTNDIVLKTLCEKCSELLLDITYEQRVKYFGEKE